MTTARTLCISADSHIVEPAEFFEPLVEMYGEEAPHIVTPNPEESPRLYLGDGKFGLGVAGFLQHDVDFTSPEARESRKLGYKLARPGCYDTAERLNDQGLDGIDAEVLYPSMLFNVYQIPNLDIVKATFRLYNDWIADYCGRQPERLFALGAVQLFDLDQAILEMDRVKQMGHVGVCIPATAPPDHLYSDPWYDRFWAAAQDLKIPLSMHIFTGATRNHGLADRQASSKANHPMAFAGAGMTICDLIQSGVCERFPDLKFVITEFETGWVAHLLRRLDWLFVRDGGTRTSGLSMLPSAYWRRNFAITFEDDPLGIITRNFIGTETMLWGNDYPHGDSIFPHSQRVLGEIMTDCTPEERWQMTVKNVVDLYDLPFELAGPSQARINSVPSPTVKTWRNAMPLTEVTLTTPMR